MVQYGRSSRSSWMESVRSSFSRTIMGKANWENPIEVRLGEGFHLGTLISCTVKKGCSHLCMWMTSNWVERNNGHPLAGLLWEREFEKILLKHGWEKIPNCECLFVHREKRVILICVCGCHKIGWKETKSWSDLESTQQRSRFGRANIFCWSCVLGLYWKTMWNKQRYCWQLRNHVWIQNFSRRKWKITMLGKSVYLFVVRRERSCQEMCGTILWVGKLDDSTTLQSVNSIRWWHHFKEEELKSVGEVPKVCSQIVLKYLYLTRLWRLDILCSVNKLARLITKWIEACDKRLCCLISYIHHTCEYKQYCHVGNCQTMQTGTVSRLRFCRRSWWFKIYFGWNTVHFRKSYICSNQLDVWETSFSFAQLLKIENSIELIWTPKSKSNTSTPKTKSQTYWPREISHVMNGIIFCVCSTLAISVLQIVLKWCRKERKKNQVKKELQQSRSRWWIWSRDAAKYSWCATFYGIRKCGENRHESQFPLSSRTEQHHRTGRPVKDAYSSSYSEWNVDKTWSSQEWKSDELMEVRTGRVVNEQPPGLFTQHTDKFAVETDNMDLHRSRIRNVVRIQMIKCERGRTNPQKMQRKTDTLRHEECLCLLHYKHLYSLERITRTFCIP